MHGAERSRTDGREGAFISLKEKRADASIAVARIAQCRGADGEIVEGSHGAAMVASFATTATMNTDQAFHRLARILPRFVSKMDPNAKRSKRFQLPTCKLLVAGQDLNLVAGWIMRRRA